MRLIEKSISRNLFDSLKEYYSYEKLRKAYHHYDKMKED